MFRNTILILAILLFSVGLSAQTKLAVLDLADKGVGKEVASLLTGVVSNQLSQIGIFEVISREDVKNMLTHGQDKVLLGCSDESCLVDIGGILGAQHLVAGEIGMVGKKYVINLQRIEVKKAKVAKRVERQFQGSKDKLLQEVKNAAYKVVEDILKAQSGVVLLSVSEEGADISIDGKTVGSSPLKNLVIPAGPRDIRVAKEGFIDWVRTVQVTPKNVLTVDVTMIPSASFIQDYEDRALSMRRWAWITLATAIALEGAAIGLRTYTYLNYDSIEKDYENENYGGLTALEYYNKYKDDMDRAEVMDYTALGMGLVGIGVSVVCLYLFLEGGDPGRYDQFKGIKSSSKENNTVSFQPVISGDSFTLSWKF
jgi:hypothetical protein